jgi:hypothetical protein
MWENWLFRIKSDHHFKSDGHFTISTGITLWAYVAQAALFIHHRRFAAFWAQITDLHYFFNPKNVRANLRMNIAISRASFASAAVGWFPG